MTLQTQSEAGSALLTSAAAAAAAVLPAVTPLSPADPQPGTPHVTSSFAGATIAELDGLGGGPHRIAILVGQDLVDALAQSPLGGLDLAAATQPAIDAAAGQLGATARAATVVELSLVVSDLGGPFTAVPLLGDSIDAAVLLTDGLLAVNGDQPQATGPDQPTIEAAGAPAASPMTSPMASPITGPGPGQAAPIGATGQSTSAARGISMLAGVDMEVTVELGRTRMTVRDLLALAPGTVLELDRAAGGPADLLVNGRLIARGEVVVVDEDFGLRITEIVDDASA